MEKAFEKEYSLRISDYDCHKRLQPASILDLFQDAAARHAETMGVGFDAMIVSKHIWVLVKVKFQVVKNPPMFAKVKVRTWPLNPQKFSFTREYLMMDESGEILVKGSSEWVVMHSEKRRLVPAIDAYPSTEGHLDEKVFEDDFVKLADFEPTDEGVELSSKYSQIDINGHVNNIQYANFVLDNIEGIENKEIDTFRIDFNREVRPDSILRVYCVEENNVINAKGISDGSVKNFACRITFK